MCAKTCVRLLRMVSFLMSKIVVVNDEPNILEIVQSLLQEEGYSVRAFAHGFDALAAISAEPADLLITDGSNRPMTGVELVRRLREVSDVPVVFLSAWAREIEAELRGTELEAQDYIELPFSGAELVKRVWAVLERRFTA